MSSAGAIAADAVGGPDQGEFPRWVVPHFRAAAILNWSTCLPNFLFPALMADIIGVPPVNYAYVPRAFAGLGIVFGFIYFEISRDPLRNRNLIKWGWIAKSVSFITVFHGYLIGEAYPLVLAFFVIEDLIWVPSFIYYDIKLKALAMRRSPSRAAA